MQDERGLLEKNGTSVVLVWYKDQIPSDDLKWDLVDLTIQKATFKDPVYGDDHGRGLRDWQVGLRALGDGSFTSCPFGTPTMLAERARCRGESRQK